MANNHGDESGTKAPRALLGAKLAYSSRDVVTHLYRTLRGFEARAAVQENRTIVLGQAGKQRNVEGDGTLVRKFRISSRSKAWEHEASVTKGYGFGFIV